MSESVAPRVAAVEIGKSRTRAAVVELSRPTALVNAHVLDTADIGGRKSFQHVLDLFARLIDHVESLDGAALSLGGPIDYATDSLDVVGPGLADPGVWPSNLSAVQAAVATATHVARVTVVNDAVAFAYAVAWDSASVHDTLCLTLGTGIGAATLTSTGRHDPTMSILPLEVHLFRRHWPCCFTGSPHQLAGGAFFRYARTTDWHLDEVRREFTLRVNWIVQALRDAVPFRTTVLGGGRSAWIDPGQLVADVTIADPGSTNGNVGASAAWYWQHHRGIPPQAIVSASSSLS